MKRRNRNFQKQRIIYYQISGSSVEFWFPNTSVVEQFCYQKSNSSKFLLSYRTKIRFPKNQKVFFFYKEDIKKHTERKYVNNIILVNILLDAKEYKNIYKLFSYQSTHKIRLIFFPDGDRFSRLYCIYFCIICTENISRKLKHSFNITLNAKYCFQSPIQ